MLSRSYFILSPAGPTDIGAAEITQRLSIPLIWAFAIASPNATFRHEGGNHFFETTVGDALSMLDRGLAAWNYNSYFRDILAPVGIFRSWLANYPSETSIYVNVTELLRRSPNPDRDIAGIDRIVTAMVGGGTLIGRRGVSHGLPRRCWDVARTTRLEPWSRPRTSCATPSAQPGSRPALDKLSNIAMMGS